MTAWHEPAPTQPDVAAAASAYRQAGMPSHEVLNDLRHKVDQQRLSAVTAFAIAAELDI